VDDSGPNGNGDGVLDPGETAIIPVTVRNTGDAGATSVIGRLYSSYPGLLTVFDGTAPFPDIPVSGQGTSLSPHFEVTVQPGAGCGQILMATMSTSGDGFSGKGTGFTLDLGIREDDLPSPDTPIAISRQTPSTVNSYINVPDSFPVKEVDVTVNVDLGDISLMEILLYPPGGATPIYLHNETGPGVDGLHTTYGVLTEPDGPGSLDDIIGLEAQGTWRLKVNHLDPGAGRGTLEDWTLHIKSDTPFGCNPVSCGEVVPPPVGQTLMVDKSGTADVQISWSGVGASDYNVWRSTDAGFSKGERRGVTGGATSYVDTGAQALSGLHFYVARSVNSCNWESP
jgi:subtilisin-like proprotein convertase family protein